MGQKNDIFSKNVDFRLWFQFWSLSLYYKIILSALKRSGKFEELLKRNTIAGAV